MPLTFISRKSTFSVLSTSVSVCIIQRLLSVFEATTRKKARPVQDSKPRTTCSFCSAEGDNVTSCGKRTYGVPVADQDALRQLASDLLLQPGEVGPYPPGRCLKDSSPTPLQFCWDCQKRRSGWLFTTKLPK